MLHKSILLILACALTIKTFAQDTEKNVWSINASAFTPNLSHHGVKIGVENNFLLKEKLKEKGDGSEKTIQKHTYYGGNLGYYSLPKASNNLFVEAILGKRRIGEQNFIHGGELGLMFINAFNYGKTYTVDDSNTVNEVKKASNRYIAPKIAYEVGYLISDKVGISLKFDLFVLTRHYKSIVPQVASELCLSYPLN